MSDNAISKDTMAAQLDAPARPTPLAGLGVLAAVVVVLAIFVALAGALGVGDVWVAFLFLLYWSGFEHGKFDKLPGAIVGAVVGLATAWELQALPGALGTAGGVIVGITILVSIYCLIVGWMPLLVNYCSMLFLTVATLPAVQANASFPSLLRPLGLGVIYFVGVAWLVQKFARRSPTTPPH
jgi:hypothetical protein